MTTYTIQQALKEIRENFMDFSTHQITDIIYEDDSKTKFLIDYDDRKFIINLNDYTYTRIE